MTISARITNENNTPATIQNIIPMFMSGFITTPFLIKHRAPEKPCSKIGGAKATHREPVTAESYGMFLEVLAELRSP
jgi:hypothetical protein